MRIPALLTTAAVAAALGFATPVSAQHHGGGGGGHASSRGQSQSHASAAPRATPAPAPAPRVNAQPRMDAGSPRFNNTWRGPAPQAQGQAVARPAPGAANNAYRNYGSYNRSYGAYTNRSYGGAYNHNYNYGYHGGYAYHGGGYYYHAPVHFYHPYYAFHPRFSIGFGLWAGYPVPYAYAYYNPYYYGYPYPAPTYPEPYPSYPPPTDNYPPSNYPQSGSDYPPSDPPTVQDPNSIGVQPGQANLGGLSFDITPRDAEIRVDGNVVGTVDQFTASSQPLGLPAGRHQVQLEAQGYRTITFDVNIIAGQVIPYQGAMDRR